MKINIAASIDENKLIGELNSVTPDAVLLMSADTVNRLSNISDTPICCSIPGIRSYYKGYKVFIDNELAFGEVDIR